MPSRCDDIGGVNLRLGQNLQSSELAGIMQDRESVGKIDPQLRRHPFIFAELKSLED